MVSWIISQLFQLLIISKKILLFLILIISKKILAQKIPSKYVWPFSTLCMKRSMRNCFFKSWSFIYQIGEKTVSWWFEKNNFIVWLCRLIKIFQISMSCTRYSVWEFRFSLQVTFFALFIYSSVYFFVKSQVLPEF